MSIGQDWWRWDDEESVWRALRTDEPAPEPPDPDGKEVLLVTSSSVLSSGDTNLRDLLLGDGWNVTVRTLAAAEDYTGVDVVVLRAGAETDSGRYLFPPVGIVAVDCWREVGMGTQIGWENTVNDLEVVDPSSPLAAGHVGTFDAYQTPAYITWEPDNHPGLQTAVTRAGQPTRRVIFAYEAGTVMPGRYATTRHVGIGFHRDGFTAGLSTVSRAQFLSAVRWARDTAVVPPGPPPAPTGVSARSGDGRVDLSWDPVLEAETYLVRRATTSGGAYTTVASGLTSTSYTDRDVTNGTTYFYVVAGYNSAISEEYDSGVGPDSAEVSATPTAAEISAHFFATSAEIAEWQSRSVSGPYRSTGDVSTNSPNDWLRAASNASNFDSNPTQSRWVQPGTGYIKSGDPWPGGSGSGTTPTEQARAADAAFVAMVTGNASLRDKVKAELLWQVNESSTSSLNYSRWDPSYPGFYPSPMFAISRWVLRWLNVYDRLGRDQFTASQLNQIDRWFYGHANYFTRIIDRTQSNSFPNRWSLDWSSRPSGGGTGYKSYDGGPLIYPLARHHNNRALAIGGPAAVIAAYLQNNGYVAPTSNPPSYGFWSVADLVKHGLMYFNEFMRFTIYPQGFLGDFERGRSNPTTGMAYSLAVTAYLSEMAEAYWRNGDTSLYDLTTTDGMENSQGAPTLAGYTAGKSLEFILVAIGRYTDDKWGRRYDGNVMWDPSQVTDLQHARANLHFNNAYLKRIYLRTESGTPSYPSSPTGIGRWGSANSWRGHHAISPGQLLQYGQMEGLH